MSNKPRRTKANKAQPKPLPSPGPGAPSNGGQVPITHFAVSVALQKAIYEVLEELPAKRVRPLLDGMDRSPGLALRGDEKAGESLAGRPTGSAD